MSMQDHDLLQQIANDVKHIVDWSEKHELTDEKRFAKVDSSLEFGKKILYGGIGIIVFLEFMFKAIK